jgi:hypothetical protein
MFTHGDHTHTEADVARLCEMGLTTPCGWLYLGFPEVDEVGDGTEEYQNYLADMRAEGPVEMECGAASWANARGWTCENGHEHVTAEVRVREGWDYAADEGEAYLLRKYGVDAVAMDGTGIASAVA